MTAEPDLRRDAGVEPLQFLVSGRTPDGARVVRWIEAEGAAEALARAADEPLEDLSLHTDEAAALVSRLAREEARRHGVTVAPRDPEAELRGLSTVPSWRTRAVATAARLHPSVLVVYPAMMWAENWWHVGLLFVVCLLIELVVAGLSLRARLATGFVDLTDAIRRRRARDASKHLRRIEKSLEAYKLTHVVGTVVLARARAQTLGLLGRRDEAMRELDRIVDEAGAPAWLYWQYRASLHTTLQEYAEQLDAQYRADELGPPMATLRLDQALLLALRFSDPGAARTWLESALQLPMTDQVAAVAPVVEGFVLLSESRPEAARERFQRVIHSNLLERFPMARPFRTLAWVGLCLTATPIEARAAYAEVGPDLEASGEHDLLARCRAAVSRVVLRPGIVAR